MTVKFIHNQTSVKLELIEMPTTDVIEFFGKPMLITSNINGVIGLTNLTKSRWFDVIQERQKVEKLLIAPQHERILIVG